MSWDCRKKYCPEKYKIFPPRKLKKIAEKCPKKGGENFFRNFLLVHCPPSYGPGVGPKIKKKVEKKFRLGVIEEK